MVLPWSAAAFLLFNQQEKERLENQNLRNDGSGDRFDTLNADEKIELQNLLREQEYNFWRENTEDSYTEFLANEGDVFNKYTNAQLEGGQNGEESSNTTNDTKTSKNTGFKSNPLRKIAGGRVLQYPIDLDTDIQDYFEIQVFN